MKQITKTRRRSSGGDTSRAGAALATGPERGREIPAQRILRLLAWRDLGRRGSPPQLATLRAKMLDAILVQQAVDLGGNLALSDFDAPHKLQVVEADAASFLHAEEERAHRAARPARTVGLPTTPVDTRGGTHQRGV